MYIDFNKKSVASTFVISLISSLIFSIDNTQYFKKESELISPWILLLHCGSCGGEKATFVYAEEREENSWKWRLGTKK